MGWEGMRDGSIVSPGRTKRRSVAIVGIFPRGFAARWWLVIVSLKASLSSDRGGGRLIATGFVVIDQLEVVSGLVLCEMSDVARAMGAFAW